MQKKLEATKSNRSMPREPRKLGNVAFIALMLLSLCALSVIRERYALYKRSEGGLEQNEPMRITAKVQTADSPAEEEEALRVGEGDDDDSSGTKPCYRSSRRSETCKIHGDIRVHGRSQTIFVGDLPNRWKVKPYCRKHDPFALAHVKEWTLEPATAAAPQCTKNHTTTAFVFDNGGFTGNLFHDYTDVLVPLFVSSHHFHRDVQFLVSTYKAWWITKYLMIFEQLSDHEVLDADNDDEVHCYPSAVVGPTFHKELGVDPTKTPPPGYSMADFKKLLRESFGLERATATPSGDQWDIRRKPRLLIISRKTSRSFLNERAMVDMATSLGFDVRVGEPDINTDVAKFGRLVNSADVMIGAHGAGLTNMVFLPAGAVLIQVVPFGGLEWLARTTFKEPSEDMQVHYLEYMIQLDETTLAEQYSEDDPVLRDPHSIQKQGWDALKRTYLDKQDLRPHLGRLKNTFLEALKLLPHSQMQ